MPNRFSSNSSSGRKLLLEQLTNQDCVVQVIRSKIDDYLYRLNNELSVWNKEKVILSVQKEALLSDIKRIESELTSMPSFEEKYKEF